MQSSVAKRYREAYGDEALPVSLESEPIKTKLVRVDWLLMVGLAVIAGAIRFYSLGHAGLWFDELWTWRITHLGVGGLVSALPQDIHMPNYFLITIAFMKALGSDSEFVMRLPSAIFGTLAVPAIYVFGRRLFGRPVGAMAAIMLCLSETSFYYSQEARPYSMMLFLAIVTSYLWYQLYERVFVDQQRPGNLAIWLFVLVAINCFTHYFCILLTIFQLSVFGYIAYKQKRGRRVLAAYLIALAVLGALWAPMLSMQLKNLFHWTLLMPFGDAVEDFLSFSFTGSGMNGARLVFPFALSAFCLGFLVRSWKGVPGLETFIRDETKKDFDIALVLSLAWLAPFAVTQFVSTEVTPIYVDRYLLFTLPFGFLALSFQISRLRFSASRSLTTTLQLVIALITVGVPAAFSEVQDHYYTQPRRDHQGDWPKVVEYLKDKIPTDGKTVVLAVTERTGVEQYYFHKFLPQLEIGGEADTKQSVGPAFVSVLKKNPDHILLFSGQVIQIQTLDALKLAGGILQKNYGKPRFAAEDGAIRVYLFDVHH